MRRLARWLFTLCSAVSLLLCVAVCVLWLRSYAVGWLAYWSWPRTELQCGASRGVLWIYWATEPLPPRAGHVLGGRVERFRSPTHPKQWGYGPRDLPYLFDVAGFTYGSGAYARVLGRSARVVIVPGWGAAAFTLLPALLWLHRRRAGRRRQARAAAGLCPGCGYDLRASPDRCPECGTATRRRGSNLA